ncbi:MAG: ATP-dependent 6-phosphofructokinase [Candidatus Bathyarchaeia archaeon]|nr:6-phosphofructokinase [Candidatus Bathyarchaeota archaeon]
MRVGVLTGGGDAPGLNAAIRAIVKKCEKYGFEVLGIRRGWAGMLEGDAIPLKYDNIKDIIGLGGTIIKTSRTNPLKQPDGIKRIVENYNKLNLSALIAIGGDDTLSVAKAVSEAGLNVIGIPKTIDYDVPETEHTIGFDTAVNEAMHQIENIKATADAHERVFVVEIMGRYAGWIALYSGLAAGADLILIPEEPFSITDVVNFVKRKIESGQKSLVIVVAEGALIKDYKGPITKDVKVDQFGHVYLGGIGEFLAKEIEKALGIETRHVVPAHTIRGGSPTAFDRIISTRYGLAAVDLVREGKFGVMVALKGGKITTVPLSEVTGRTKKVDLELYNEAKVFFE